MNLKIGQLLLDLSLYSLYLRFSICSKQNYCIICLMDWGSDVTWVNLFGFNSNIDIIARKLLDKLGLGVDYFQRRAFFTAFFTDAKLDKTTGNEKQGIKELLSLFKNFYTSDGGLSYFLGGAFSSISLPEVDIEYYQITSVNRLVPYQALKHVSYSPVTLRRGLTVFYSPFWHWLRNMHDKGIVERKNVVILQLARPGQVPLLGPIDSVFGGKIAWVPVMMHRLIEASPSKISWGEMDALSSDIVIEEVELVYNNYEVVDMFDAVKSLVGKASSLIK